MMLSGLDLLFTADYLVGFCPCPDRWGRWCCPVQWTPRRGTGIRLHSSHPPLFDLLCTRHQPLTHLDSHLSVWPSGTGTCPSLQLSVHNTRQHAVRGTVVFLGAAGYADEPHTTEPHSHFNLKPSLDGILEPFTWTTNLDWCPVHDKNILSNILLGLHLLLFSTMSWIFSPFCSSYTSQCRIWTISCCFQSKF